jgi:ribulose-5-phosphate 4-epimerase/fuculose-1-phosphate aldolase
MSKVIKILRVYYVFQGAGNSVQCSGVDSALFFKGRKMEVKIEERIEEFVEAGRRVGSYGLLRCSSGNMSRRIEDGLVLLSSSGSWLGEITSEEVAVCRLQDGQSINGKKATVESKFHLGILRKRADVNVVLHFQSPYALAVACSKRRDYNFFLIPATAFYVGEPAMVDYLRPGSAELAEAVVSASEEHDMIIMRKHGAVTVGKDFNDVIQKAMFFELVCEVLIHQPNVEALTKEEIEELKKNSSKV